MTQKYRLIELTTARTESVAARARYDSALTLKAKRAAAEDLEFWSNKVAFLSNPRIVS